MPRLQIPTLPLLLQGMAATGRTTRLQHHLLLKGTQLTIAVVLYMAPLPPLDMARLHPRVLLAQAPETANVNGREVSAIIWT